jgi:hypothetical protein
VSRPNSTFSERAEVLDRLSFRLRLAAVGEGLLAGSPEEAEVLAPWLVEALAASPFVERPSAVRALWEAVARFLGIDTAEHRAMLAAGQIVRCWGTLPELVRIAALACGRGRWGAVLPGVATDDRAEVRLGAAWLAFDAGDFALAPTCVELLTDPSPAVADMSERALVALALRRAMRREGGVAGEDAAALRPLGDGAHPDEARRLLGVTPLEGTIGDAEELADALAHAAARYGEHRRRGVLLAMTALLDRSTARFGTDATGRLGAGSAALAGAFHRLGEEAQAALRTILGVSRLPLVRLRALEWMTHEGLSAACVRRLATKGSVAEQEMVLRSAHLGLRPRRAAPLARIALRVRRDGRLAAGACVPNGEEVEQLSTRARRGLALWVRLIDADAPAAHAALWPLATDEDASVRHAAVRNGPRRLARDLCFDADERVARSAALRLAGGWAGVMTAAPAREGGREAARDMSERRRGVLLSRSAHESVRLIAAGEPSWGRGAEESGVIGVGTRLRARLALRADPAGFARDLRATIVGGGDDEACARIVLARRLGLAGEVRREALALAADESARPRASASALTLLGDLDDAECGRVLRAALASGEARRRANASEAIARRCRRGVDRPDELVELAADPHHRVRATLVRAALAAWIGGWREEAALRTLEEMLASAGTPERLSGAWAAGRAAPARGLAAARGRWGEIGARLVEIAAVDADARVRARAMIAAERLGLRTVERVGGIAGGGA